jgi:chromosome condensin MukBEF complex kleisin-like MukF subunit
MFGYNKQAVASCISALESEHSAKLRDQQKQAEDAQAALRSQIDALQEAHSAELADLNRKVEELTSELNDLKNRKDSIVGAILGAQE